MGSCNDCPAVRTAAGSAGAERGCIVPGLCAGIVSSHRASEELADDRSQEGQRRKAGAWSLLLPTQGTGAVQSWP